MLRWLGFTLLALRPPEASLSESQRPYFSVGMLVGSIFHLLVWVRCISTWMLVCNPGRVSTCCPTEEEKSMQRGAKTLVD